MPWPPKHIALVGVELEGGWKVAPNHPMHTDVSVTVRGPYVGEVSSPPMPATEVLDWMVRPDIYPDYGNGSCGMHVHISTKDNNTFAWLMEKEFYKAFLQAMQKWGNEKRIPLTDPFWLRLNGKNRYCRAEFKPMEQYRSLDRELRRTQLNFCSYSQHGTMECRMFPLFSSPRLGRSAVKAYLTFIDDWLENNMTEEVKDPIAVYREAFDMKPFRINIERTIECS